MSVVWCQTGLRDGPCLSHAHSVKCTFQCWDNRLGEALTGWSTAHAVPGSVPFPIPGYFCLCSGASGDCSGSQQVPDVYPKGVEAGGVRVGAPAGAGSLANVC